VTLFRLLKQRKSPRVKNASPNGTDTGGASARTVCFRRVRRGLIAIAVQTQVGADRAWGAILLEELGLAPADRITELEPHRQDRRPLPGFAAAAPGMLEAPADVLLADVGREVPATEGPGRSGWWIFRLGPEPVFPRNRHDQRLVQREVPQPPDA